MKELFHTIKNVFRKIHKTITAILNFLFMIPIYFIGAGLSRIFYRPKQEQPKDTYWQKPEFVYKRKDFENLF